MGQSTRKEAVNTAKERVKRYEEAGISKDRYLELKYIARQYDSMRRAEARLRRGEIDRESKGNQGWKQPDPTGNAAIGIAMRSYAQRIKAIEDSAHAAGDEIYPWLMKCVTRGETYEHLGPPCGRAQFYHARRRFYVELDARI